MAHDQRPSGRVALIFTIVTVLLAFNTTASAQGAGTYLSLVEQYAGGDATGAVTQLARWSDQRLTGAIDEWMRQLSTNQLRAAAMMHTDLACALTADRQASRASIQIRNADRLIAIMIGQDHDTESARAFAVRWYAFTTSLYTAQGQPDAADRVVRSGLAIFPRAAELYVARGSIQEMRANMEESDLLRRAIYGGSDRVATHVARLLEYAAADFQNALDLDGALAVAHLHRGWVHHVLDDKRASGDLEAALADATDDSVRYLAHLFLGAVAERRNNLDAARREFEAAKALGPYQTSYVALGRVEWALGHNNRAWDIAAEYAQLTNKGDDPWWDYRIGGFNASALFWLRAEARRP